MQHKLHNPINFSITKFRRPLIATTPATSYASDSYVYSSTMQPPQPQSSTQRPTVSHVTTPVPPSLHSAKSISDRKLSVSIPLATLRVTMETSSIASNHRSDDDQFGDDEQQQKLASEDSTKMSSEDSTKINDDELNHVESITTNDAVYTADNDPNGAEGVSEKIEDTTSIEQRLKKISEEIEKYSNGNNNNADNVKSILSLADLVGAGRNPSERKVIPQIDSDYSNTMHVLGETTDDSRKYKPINLRQTNRALY
ncbi:ras guanine nucleotide exchange factor Y isoform X3 [Contarinia nasturtii]|uniref:ras guanine nucleotide exchange factor Y isoform X3 n=1 Tax=Contarinia nasturtii TaxID=265458 RepID=UPI0012D37C6B|nr:ras guanine nucleotide exchange factor Y isoform X3 [Contarinia nasturtii]XP_031639616.1 ras guanine nucleotide exchange factor Y isoform X3 [Contarinia nasturtii]